MPVARSAPSAHGVDPAAVGALVDALEGDGRIDPHGLVIQRHGHRVVEAAWAPHRTDHARLVYSLSKTFTGAALALQLGEGRLTLDDFVGDHLPDLLADADARTRRTRIRHLASMATGHEGEMLLDAIVEEPTDPLAGFFRLPPEHEPGSRFAYSQPPVLALATILQRLAGTRLSEYLRPRLLEPLGIGDLAWTEYRPGIELGFSGVFTTLDAVARMGQLHLDDGVWAGRRILPYGWVAQASAPQVANPLEPYPDWRQGYGFGVWRSRHGYRGDGAFGQLMVVLPEQDAVVAVFAETAEMQVELDHVWAQLLPGLRDAAPSPRADARLADRLATLRVPTAGRRVGGRAPRSGRQRFTPGPPTATTQLSVTAVELDGDELVVHERDASIRVPLRATWTTARSMPVSASATEDATGRIVTDLVFLETPHRLHVTLDPVMATFDASWHAMPIFGAGVEPRLVAMRAPASFPQVR